MVALSESPGGARSVVGRVRELIATVDAAPGASGGLRVDARLMDARGQSAVQDDLLEIESRLVRLRSLWPDLAVEVGPLVERASGLLRGGCPDA